MKCETKRYLFLITGMVMGGAERVMATLANEFASKGNEVLILTLKDSYCAYRLDSRVKIKGVGGHVHSKHKWIRSMELVLCGIKSFFFYLNTLRNYKPDVVLSFLTFSNLLAVFVRQIFVRYIPVIISERCDPMQRGFFIRTICELIYPKADCLVCQSHTIGEYFYKRSKKVNIKVIPNPINEECIAHTVPSIRRNVIAAVGRLNKQKNYDLLIDSFYEMRNDMKDYKVEIYGQGPEYDRLKNKIKKLHLEDNIFLMGTKNNVMHSIYDAKLFVMTSDYEGFPNALTEAMASGLPVISTDFPTGIAREVIKEGVNGYVVPVKDKKELVRVMLHILNNPKLQETMSEENRKIIRILDNETIMEQWKNTLNQSYPIHGKKGELMNELMNKVLQEPKRYFIYALGRLLYGSVWLDKLYLKILYRYKMGKRLNLKNPKTYNEKIQWLKLYDRNPEYINLADKYEVRNYIAKTIGDNYLVPLLGVWDKFEEIDFDKLPNQFILKCTHDSGGNVICKDKSTFDKEAASKKLNHCLKRNYYKNTREWPYKNIKPRIIAEKYLVDESGTELKDYKFLCFYGVPKAFLVISNRGQDTRSDFYNMNFKHLPVRHHYKNSEIGINRPEGFREMVELSKKLSKGFIHIRCDFYNIYGKIYFGELTFYQFSGLYKIEPESFDRKLGSFIHLPLK